MINVPKLSFRKVTDLKKPPIKGTSASLYNNQLLVSSGISSFDNVVGGGIPVGSLVIINEDKFGGYASSVLKYFLAEGVVCQHVVYLCSEEINPEVIIKELPNPVDAEAEEENENASDGKKMAIAWRYENLKPTSSMDKTRYFGHFYDFSQKMDEKFYKNTDISCWPQKTVSSGDSFEQTGYYQLLQSIKEKLEKNSLFSNSTNSGRNIIRIGLHHIGSPAWKYDTEDDVNDSYFFKFLLYLRALIRNAYATCMVTIPYNKHKKDFIDKCIHFADIAVHLQSFAGTKLESLAPYKDYHGIFVIQKLAAINCWTAYNSHPTNLAFRLRRKKFVIEEFCLPPELEDTIERDISDSSVLNCSSFPSKKLDF